MFRRLVFAAAAILLLCTAGIPVIWKNSGRVPIAVSEFAGTHPEAKVFAKNLLWYTNRKLRKNVSRAMADREIPLYLQWDMRWGYRKYGSSLIGTAGCGPACLSMVVSGLKKDPSVNPYTVSTYAESREYYIEGQGSSWKLMTEGAEHFGLQAEQGEVTEDFILENLTGKSPMICSVLPGDFTSDGHFVVLTGIDEDGKILLNDPNNPEKSIRHWDLSVLLPQIKGIWVYRFA